MQLWEIDPDLEDGKTIFLHDTLAHDDVITIPSLATKGKTSFSEVFNLYHDLDLEHSKAIFLQDILVFDDVPSD